MNEYLKRILYIKLTCIFFYLASIHALKRHTLIEKYRHARNYKYSIIEAIKIAKLLNQFIIKSIYHLRCNYLRAAKFNRDTVAR